MPLWDGHFLIVGKCSEGKVRNVKKYFIHAPAWNGGPFQDLPGGAILRATPHNSRLTAQAPLRRLRHGICVAKMLDNVGLRYPYRASGAKAPRTLRPLPLLRFAVSATGGAHLCSIQYHLRFWLGICRTSLAVSALRIMRCCPIIIKTQKQYNSHNGQARCGCCFWCPFSRGKKSVPIYFDCIVDTAIIMPPP